MFKNLFILLLLYTNIVFSDDLEITKWFNKESKQFLEIMNNSDVEKHQDYQKYQEFVENNFAIKSIAYGLISEKIINNNKEELLIIYQDTFKSYLTKTIYNLANSTTTGTGTETKPCSV